MEETFEAGNCKVTFECGKCGEKNIQGFRFLIFNVYKANGNNYFSSSISCEKCNSLNYLK